MQGVILNPSGNITGLVLTELLPDNSQEIATNIMRKNGHVEQIGFLSYEKKSLHMAGGEFCANAARAAVWQLLGGKEGRVILSVSGYDGKVYGSILPDGKVCVKMYNNFCRSVSIGGDMIGLVHLQGISHIVVPVYGKIIIDTLKNSAKEYLENFGLLSYDAAGVMFVSIVNNIVSLYPIVWVRDIQTFIFESSCGSGTIAYALYNHRLNKVNNISVLQPSGSRLHVELSDSTICLLGEVSFVQNM